MANMSTSSQSHKVSISSPGVYNVCVRYVLSCCAAGIAETVTYPLDLTKTRLQISNEQLHGQHSAAAISSSSGAKPTPAGMLRTAYGIAANEGVLQLFQGLSPAIIRHFVYTGCRTAIYELIREDVLKRDAHGHYPAWKSAIGGLTAGGVSQLMASPTDLVKVTMQMEGRRKLLGLPTKFTGSWQAFQYLLRRGGFIGLWTGWLPNVQRACLVNMADMLTYDQTKHALLRHTSLPDNMILHACSSVCSGFCSAVLGTPADVVKTRVMNDSGRELYRGSVDCLVKTLQHEGFFALYKGFVPIWLRMAPWSLTFWISYEKIRIITGMSSF